MKLSAIKVGYAPILSDAPEPHPFRSRSVKVPPAQSKYREKFARWRPGSSTESRFLTKDSVFAT
jgi:hypothetical protein